MQRQLPLQSLFILIFLLGCGESKHLSEARKAALDSKSTDQEALQSIAAWCSWNPSETRYTGANVDPWQDGYRVTAGYILNPQRRFIKSVDDFKHAVRVEAAAMVICMFRAGKSRKIRRIELSVALPLEQTSQLAALDHQRFPLWVAHAAVPAGDAVSCAVGGLPSVCDLDADRAGSVVGTKQFLGRCLEAFSVFQ